MKQITIFLMCFFFGAVSVAFAQQGFYVHDGFRVSVFNDAEEPLIGAYIYVNDKPAAATDTLGLAVIPLEKIKLGDSITVSYVATKGESVVVDRIMLIKGEYEFFLEGTHGTLYAEAVTVKAKIKRLYRKSLPVRRLPPYGYYGLYSTHFTMNITNPGDSVPSHWVAGRVEGIYTSLYISEKMFSTRYSSVLVHSLNPDPTVLDSLQRAGFNVGFVNDYPLEIFTNDDTTSLEQTLRYFLPRALRASNLALYRVHDPEPDYKELAIYPKVKVNYGYLGKDQDTSTFHLTYSGHGAGTASEVVMRSDIADNFNRELVEASLSFKDTINGNSYYVKAKIQDTIIWEHIGGITYSDGTYRDWSLSIFRQVPFELKYSIQESNGTRVNITMSNIHFRSVFEKMKPSLEVLFKIYRPITQYEFITLYYTEIESYLKRMVHDKKRAEQKQQKKLERAN